MECLPCTSSLLPLNIKTNNSTPGMKWREKIPLPDPTICYIPFNSYLFDTHELLHLLQLEGQRREHKDSLILPN